MRTYKEIDDLRISLNKDFSKLFKEGIINKFEFDLSIKQIMLNIKNQYNKEGFKTDVFTIKDLNKPIESKKIVTLSKGLY